MSSLLKDRGQNAFQEQWPFMEPVIQCLLRQEHVSKADWQNLFWSIHTVCLWDEKGAPKVYRYLQEAVCCYVKQALTRVQRPQDEFDILRAYIAEWRVFFAQCGYLPLPFGQLEQVLSGKQTNNTGIGSGVATTTSVPHHHHHNQQQQDSIVRKLMLETWHHLIFVHLRDRLLRAAMSLLTAERCGQAASATAGLIAGVRDSFVHLCCVTNSSATAASAPTTNVAQPASTPTAADRLQLYRQYFETVYIECLRVHYGRYAGERLASDGVLDYMVYADAKLIEEEERGRRYLEPSGESLKKVRDECVSLLVTQFCDQILAECAGLIERHDTPRLALMFSLLDRIPTTAAANAVAGADAATSAPSAGDSTNHSLAAAPTEGAVDACLPPVSRGVAHMLDAMEQHIRSAGLSSMLANADTVTQDCEKYVEQLLQLFTEFSELAREAFNSDPRFMTARDKAFKDLVNDVNVFKLDLNTRPRGGGAGGAGYAAGGASKYQPESRCPELLANYCDMLLRKTAFSKRLTSDQVDEKLRAVLCLLKYVSNKDVFMRYHKGHLSRRLILDTSSDTDKEEAMVDWLRNIGMPADYVNKLARMFQDIKVSQDLNGEFHRSRLPTASSSASTSTSPSGPTISAPVVPCDTPHITIKILNTGAWSRSADRVSVSLPSQLEDFIPELEQFYRGKHSGRKLQWHHHMSYGTVTFASDLGRYDLEVTTFQMVILFAWNSRPTGELVSLETLRLATELPDSELRRTLWTLVACNKLKRQLLVCDPPVTSARDFRETSLFCVNRQFAIVRNGRCVPRGRLSVIGRLQLNTERARDEENAAIVQLRVLRTQEALVKIMKMRKTLTSAQLHAELIEILKNMFVPSRKLIKEQIEWLIENKYLRRDADDINKFVYMA